jgi:cobalt-zinc-cadmium efflux system protein
VHDLHAWSLTSGLNALSTHVVMTDGADHGAVLSGVRRIIVEGFPIAHTTIQIEPRDWEGCDASHQ